MTSGVPNPGYQRDAVRYTTPSRLQRLQGEVDEVTDVMKENIRLELERGGKLDEIESKSEMLNQNASQFAVRAKKVKQKFWWKNVKMWICLIIVVGVVIGVIVLAVVLSTKHKT